MKSTLTPKKFNLFVFLALGACLLQVQPVLAIGKPVHTASFSAAGPGEEKPPKKHKAKSKSFNVLNNNSVKIYPDPVKRTMHVIAKENDGREIDFFVFDLEGTLMQNYKMKTRDHIRIQGLARGTYVYRVFSGDEESASGNFDIR